MRSQTALAAVGVILLSLSLTRPAPAVEPPSWTIPDVRLPASPKHPAIAFTPAELEHLRSALRGRGPEHDVVARVIAEADRFLAEPLDYPPRGGQHNQWYQCEKCQIALQTLSPTQHQCPRCKTIYTGEPYDDVVFKRTHHRNLAGMLAAARAYALTGERRYAERAADVLRGYAERYLKYPYHTAGRTTTAVGGGHIDEQTLGEAGMLAGLIAPAYDLIYDSDALSTADRKAIETGLVRPMIECIGRHRAGKNNWQTWHNAAMLWGGAVLGEADLVRRAIADPDNGFAFQMRASVTADGMWYENSWGYHFYTLRALVVTAEGARRLGIDLWSHPALHKMFTLPAHYALPGGALPRFGDDVNATVNGARTLFEAAWHAYRDPAILALLPSTPDWDTIVLGRDLTQHAKPGALRSEVFLAAGHAILRTPGDAAAGASGTKTPTTQPTRDASLTAIMTFGPYGGFHGHFDKLSFVFYGLGRELGVDPGRAASQAYRLPIHTQWYKATISHNAVLVDGDSQKPAAGRLECFAANDRYAAAVARCDAAYPGVAYRRLMLLTPSYLLVFDDLDAGEHEHQFHWLYHNRGSAARYDAGATPMGRDASTAEARLAGAKYIEDVRRIDVFGPAGSDAAPPIRVAFDDNDAVIWLTLDHDDPTTITTGTGPGASIVDRVPLAIATRRGRTVHFAAAIEPLRAGATPLVRSITARRVDGDWVIDVATAAETDTVRLGPTGELRVSHGEVIVIHGEPSAAP